MKRFLIATALAAALLAPVVMQPPETLASTSCTSTGAGSNTYTRCHDFSDGSWSSGITHDSGSHSWTSIHGIDGSGDWYSGSGSTSRSGNSSSSNWSIYP